MVILTARHRLCAVNGSQHKEKGVISAEITPQLLTCQELLFDNFVNSIAEETANIQLTIDVFTIR